MNLYLTIYLNLSICPPDHIGLGSFRQARGYRCSNEHTNCRRYQLPKAIPKYSTFALTRIGEDVIRNIKSVLFSRDSKVFFWG